jgi:hypothetical protein
MATCPVPNRFRLPLAAAAVLVVLLCAFLVRFHLSFRFRGIFLLSGNGRHVLEVKDDLFLGEGNRLIGGIDFGPIMRWIRDLEGKGYGAVGLHLDWDEEEGGGTVVQRFPDGTVLETNLGRFVDETGTEVHGVIIGGAESGSVRLESPAQGSDTGMAFYDGKRWYHVWCNMNEAVHGAYETDPGRFVYPYQWRLLGTSVLRNGPRKVVLASSHAAEVDGVPIRIDRYGYFRAGETFLRLSIRIRNAGSRPVSLVYLYGDEPWVGNYGSSEGNVGWVEGGTVETVGRFDPVKYRYAGFWDHGNTRVDPEREYTGMADFVEWLGPNVPDAAWFSNAPGYDPAEERARAPLDSNSRFLGLAWGPRNLAPGEEMVIYLAQGMARRDGRTGRPVKPPVPLDAPLDDAAD